MDDPRGLDGLETAPRGEEFLRRASSLNVLNLMELYKRNDNLFWIWHDTLEGRKCGRKGCNTFMGEEIYHLNEVASEVNLTNEEAERLHLRRREDPGYLSMRPCTDWNFGRDRCFQGCRFMHLIYNEHLSEDEDIDEDDEEDA